MARAKVNVWVTPPGGGVKKKFFAAGEELPDWAAEKLGDHIVDGRKTEASSTDTNRYTGRLDALSAAATTAQENQGSEPGGATGEQPVEKPDYSKLNKDALKAEIAKRNEGREDDDVIEVDAPGNKPELIAALQADDVAQADKAEQESSNTTSGSTGDNAGA